MPKKAHEEFIVRSLKTREVRENIRSEIGECVARLVKKYPGREKVVCESLEGAYQALAAVAHRRPTSSSSERR